MLRQTVEEVELLDSSLVIRQRKWTAAGKAKCHVEVITGSTEPQHIVNELVMCASQLQGKQNPAESTVFVAKQRPSKKKK